MLLNKQTDITHKESIKKKKILHHLSADLYDVSTYINVCPELQGIIVTESHSHIS
jgi:hypothetical protein